MQISRRNFIKTCLSCSSYLAFKNLYPEAPVFALGSDREVIFYEKHKDGTVTCTTCPHTCKIKEGNRGFCRIKENRQGKLFNIVWGHPCSIHVDPIEKKPLFHVLPGTNSFSIATVGCNLRCQFCQNWQISQSTPEQVKTVQMLPPDIAKKAKETKCVSIAYTYNEPTMFYEYLIDIAVEAKKYGIINVMHSNGYLNPAPLRKLSDHIRAANVDLKAFNNHYYQKVCSGSLNEVLKSLVILKQEKSVWLELTTLIVPTLNDDLQQIKKMVLWIKKELGKEVPLHFSRFFPTYRLQALPPTPRSMLENARKTALDAGLEYVYIGNLPGNKAEHTYCPNCSSILIKRAGYIIMENNLKKGFCFKCKTQIPGVWS